MIKNFLKNAARYFFQGLLILTPIALTLYLIFYIVVKVGGWLDVLGIRVHPFVDPLIGFIAAMLIIILIGFLGTTIILQPFFLLLDRMVERAPLIKTIYSSVKDLLGAFVGNKRRFNKPVLVTINKADNICKLGFITQTDLSLLGIKTNQVAVYLPHSYAFSGVLLIVPAENVVLLNSTSAEVMKFIISGGVTEIDH